MSTRDPRDDLPDVRDGLTHRERIVLQCLQALQQERGGRQVPTGMLYGTVVEYGDMSVEEMQSILVYDWLGLPMGPHRQQQVSQRGIAHAATYEPGGVSLG